MLMQNVGRVMLSKWFLEGASLVVQRLRLHLPMQEMKVQSLGQEDPLKKEMVTQSSIFAWEISWIEEPSRLQSVGLQRVGHD